MKKTIVVASGKGGVGKSTVAANLAVALANFGVADGKPLKVALVDVDFYGPSMPTLMGGGSISPDHQGKIIPALKHGVKYISIAHFLKGADDPVIWRGPMFGKAIGQLFQDVNWGEIDLCIIDMPPGTGDAQLSVSQLLRLDGAVLVTTPQEVALSDVRRAVNMFRKVNVPVLGVIENMAGFVTPDGQLHNIFGEGGGQQLSDQYQLPLLGSIPLEIAIRKGGDIGEPIALEADSVTGQLFQQIGARILSMLENAAAPQLQVVN